MRIAPYDPAATRILARGSWPASRLRSTWMPSSHQLPPSLQGAVDDAWVDALAVPGVHLFNGAQCRLESFSVDGRGLHLMLSRTTYKAYLGTNARHPHWADRHGPGMLANPI